MSEQRFGQFRSPQKIPQNNIYYLYNTTIYSPLWSTGYPSSGPGFLLLLCLWPALDLQPRSSAKPIAPAGLLSTPVYLCSAPCTGNIRKRKEINNIVGFEDPLFHFWTRLRLYQFYLERMILYNFAVKSGICYLRDSFQRFPEFVPFWKKILL